MNSKKGDNFDPQPFVDHYVKLSSEAGEQKIVLQCGQQVPNVFRLRTTYKSNVRRNKSHKNTQSETTIHALPKSLSPVKAEPTSTVWLMQRMHVLLQRVPHSNVLQNHFLLLEQTEIYLSRRHTKEQMQSR